MIKRGNKTEELKNAVTIAIDRNQPPVVIIAHPATTCNNDRPEPQDNGNILTGVDLLISEIKMKSDDYDRQVKNFELDLEQFPAFKNLIDLAPEEINERCQAIITGLKQDLEVMEREMELVT